MKNSTIAVLLFTFAGLILGYLIFGKIAGEYVNLKAIFSASSGTIESFGRRLAGLDHIRQNILLSGLAGAVLGVVYHFINNKKN